MISVFNYTDYRAFIKDFYLDRKRTVRRYSYRALCGDAGIKSPGHLMLILSGKANVSTDLAQRLCAAMDLNKRESGFFLGLVEFNQAQSHDEKKDALEKMLSLEKTPVRLVSADQYKYYQTWYHSAIRALVEFVDVKDDYDHLAGMVEPPITPPQARRSVALMLKLGLITRDENGFLRPAEAGVDTGVQGGSTAIVNYGLSTIDLARRAVRDMPAEERKFSWVTVGVSAKGYGAILDKIRKFRADVAEIAAADSAERVYQVNMQVFPLSKPRKSGEAPL
jgi:uncharacterized protein (TIGR02147 family)